MEANRKRDSDQVKSWYEFHFDYEPFKFRRLNHTWQGERALAPPVQQQQAPVPLMPAPREDQPDVEMENN